MDYDQLSKYLAGEMTPGERDSFLETLSGDEAQLEDAARLKNMWAATQLKATAADTKIAEKAWSEFQRRRNDKPSKILLWWRVAAAVVVIGVIAAAAFFAGLRSREEIPVAYHTLSVPAGQYAQLMLADGTEIWLNSRSKLVYPDRFTEATREVKFEGEGYFKVASDKEHPFVVKTEMMDMVATGTQFNISAYRDDDWVATTLVEGVVHLHSKDNGIDYEIKSGQTAVYGKTGHRISAKPVNTDMLTSWAHGEFQFKEMPLVQITKRLERNFNVRFLFDNESMKERIFTGTFYNHQSIETILQVIRTSTKRMQYRIDDDTIYITQK